MINTRKAYTYFDNRIGLRKSTKNWYAFQCPYCHKKDKKGAVHFDFEMVKCWTCEYKKGIVEWVAEYEGVDWDTSKAIINSCSDADINFSDLVNIRTSNPDTVISFPLGYTPLTRAEGVLGKRAVEYLAGRGLNMEYLYKQQIGYCPAKHTEFKEDYFGYIILPFMTDWRLRYFIGRDYIGNFLRYKNPDAEKCGVGKSELLYNSQAVDTFKNVMLVEGLFCSLTIGSECMATMGKELSDFQASRIIKSNCEGVYIALDAGEKKASYKMATALVDYKKVYIVDLSLIAKDGKKDPNELGKQEVAYLAKHTAPVTRADILRSYWN